MNDLRGQTEPLGTLVAAIAVCVAVSLYATTLGGSLTEPTDRTHAESTLERISWAVVEAGRYRAGTLSADTVFHPAGQVVRITIAVDGRPIDQLTLDRAGNRLAGKGPRQPAAEASRTLPVVLTPGEVRDGRLTVEVWP